MARREGPSARATPPNRVRRRPGPDDPSELYFTSDGRVPQIEGAEAATRRGAPIVGLVFQRGVLLGAKYTDFLRDPLPSFLGPNTSDLRGGKLMRLGPRLALAGVGLMGDFAAVGRYMRTRSFASTPAAVDHLADFFWRHAMRHETRRLAAMVFLGSTLGGTPRLFQFSPSGSVHEYVAWAWGRGDAAAQQMLRDEYRPGSERHALEVALRALGHPRAYEFVAVRT